VLTEKEFIEVNLNLNIYSCVLKRKSSHQQIGKDYGINIAQLEALRWLT